MSSRRPSTRRISPPVVVTALVWVGVQVLVLLYLGSSLGYATERDPFRATELREAVAGASDGGLSLRTWAWITNLAFVVLLWFRFRSRPWASGRQHTLALLTYGGTALLLLLVNMVWNGFAP